MGRVWLFNKKPFSIFYSNGMRPCSPPSSLYSARSSEILRPKCQILAILSSPPFTSSYPRAQCFLTYPNTASRTHSLRSISTVRIVCSGHRDIRAHIFA
ncbi:hypothetical protein FKM82_024076 [Ascaphus truei]